MDQNKCDPTQCSMENLEPIIHLLVLLKEDAISSIMMEINLIKKEVFLVEIHWLP